jgi:hypothetical protein
VAAQLFAPNNKEKRKQEDDLKNESNEKDISKRNITSLKMFRASVPKLGSFLVYNPEFDWADFGSGSYFSEKKNDFTLEWRKKYGSGTALFLTPGTIKTKMLFQYFYENLNNFKETW